MKAAAFLLSLQPFAGLMGVVYTILGYPGLIFAGCVTGKKWLTRKQGNDNMNSNKWDL